MQKLTGTPSYEVLKGDKDSALPLTFCAAACIKLTWSHLLAMKFKRRWYRTNPPPWSRMVLKSPHTT
jgi:hypothetical protein